MIYYGLMMMFVFRHNTVQICCSETQVSLCPHHCWVYCKDWKKKKFNKHYTTISKLYSTSICTEVSQIWGLELPFISHWECVDTHRVSVGDLGTAMGCCVQITFTVGTLTSSYKHRRDKNLLTVLICRLSCHFSYVLLLCSSPLSSQYLFPKDTSSHTGS